MALEDRPSMFQKSKIDHETSIIAEGSVFGVFRIDTIAILFSLIMGVILKNGAM